MTNSLPLRAWLMVMVTGAAMLSPFKVSVALRSVPSGLSSSLTTTLEMSADWALDEGVTVHQSAPLERVMVQGVLELTLNVMASGRVAGAL